MERNIQHVYPNNDTIEHLVGSIESETEIVFPSGVTHKLIICACECHPRIQYFENGAVIVVHDAMDGRLGVEWANEILDEDGK